jgi:hypothetical protein
MFVFLNLKYRIEINDCTTSGGEFSVRCSYDVEFELLAASFAQTIKGNESKLILITYLAA